ncbi:tyrosine-type recombinase/integrase [Paenarthrobacter ureafaciens]|uniref:tyrosine-type recombinase/integrase n=1 Tax=Paenarthrobacter ureafaciens TaxID=37931 RepID=UPI003CF0748E
MADVRRTEVQQWVADLGQAGKGATTVIRAYGILAAILDDAVADRRALSNPARGVTLPRKTKKPHVYLSHEQVHSLASDSKYPALVLVLAYCGLRWGEATGLRVKHVDFLRRRFMIEENAVQVGSIIEVGTPKNHKKRTVPFPLFLADGLARQCEGKGRDDLVFPGENGHHLRLARVHEDNMSWFASAVKRSGVPRITPHDLRHSAASFAVSAGANVKAVQKMLGHSSAAMTLDVYADLFDGDLDAVSDALDNAVSQASVGKMWANQ